VRDSLNNKWDSFLAAAADNSDTPHIRYKRLENKTHGIRVSCHFPDRRIGLLVEIGAPQVRPSIDFPSWLGVDFSLMKLDVPTDGAWHVSLELNEPSFRPVFTDLCVSLIGELRETESPSERRDCLAEFLAIWSEFFDKYSYRTMSNEKQRGLFGELWWLRKLIQGGIAKNLSLTSWTGSEGNQDFVLNGHAMEVKTTLTNEPRKVHISNEKQLDNSPYRSLHLFVVTLTTGEGAEITLPELIESINSLLDNDNYLERKFDRILLQEGYLPSHGSSYNTAYTVKKEEIFKVEEGFPRILGTPSGVGDLRYSIVISACTDFLEKTEDYIDAVKRGYNE
ncbi:MAG TPA: PD-(D/E)XK motif protein, partial [Thermoplasmataceae archaeon]|nr:PD-(D/E)XK motif protein [Thermoplasmataceae archaeon]